MAKVLLVDDDNSQCMTLGLAFSAENHVVEMAKGGRMAIDVGTRYQPDVLITDYLLKDPPNGLFVSQALRAVKPATHSIMLTGCSSEDLKTNALKANFFGFFEKPVNLDRLMAGVTKGLETGPCPCPVSVGLLHFDDGGSILYANAIAKKLLSLPDKVSFDTTLAGVFSYRSLANINGRESDWFSVSRQELNSTQYHGYVKDRGAQTRFLVLLEQDQEAMKKEPALKALLGTEDANKAACPITDTVLLVDQDKLQRRLAARQLQNIGCRHHAAESYERALKTFEADKDIKVVIIDYDPEHGDLEATIENLRQLRPDTRIVGISAAFRKKEFAELGIEHFLLKPVLAATLIGMLERNGVSGRK